MTSADHVDAMTYGIAVGLVDERGKDPDWVRMVVRAKGFGDIDINAARRWVAANPDGRCKCADCLKSRREAAARQVVRPPVPVQGSLF